MRKSVLNEVIEPIKKYAGTFRDIAIRMGGIFYGRGLAFIVTIFIARFLGPEEFGHIKVAQSVLAICGIFTGAGIVNAMLTYVCQEKGDNRSKLELLFNGIILCLVLSIVVIGFTFWGIKVFNPIYDEVASTLVLYCLPSLLFPNINQLMMNFVQGFGSVGFRTFMEVISGSIYSFTIIIMISLFGLCGWATGMNLGFFMAFIVLVIVFHKFLAKRNIKLDTEKPKLSRSITVLYLKYYKWSTIGIALNVTTYSIHAIIISQIVKESDKVGLYGAAMLIFSAVGLYGQSITQAIYHKVASKHQDKAWIKRIGRQSKLFSLIPLVSLISIAIVFSKEIMILIYGKDYEMASNVLIFLLIASIFQNYIYLNGGIWISIGKIRINTLYFAIVSVVHLILVIPLTKHFSITGTACAMMLTVMFGAVLSEIINYRYVWGTHQ